MSKQGILWLAPGLAAVWALGCEGQLHGPGAGPHPGSDGSGGGAVSPGGSGGDPSSPGSGGDPPSGGSSGTGGSPGGGGPPCGAGSLPADVQALLATRCTTCHGRPPLRDVPASLVSLADLTAASRSDPARSNAQLALARMQDPSKPMPPDPLMRATAAEIAVMQRWAATGFSAAACPDAGVGAVDAGRPAADGGATIDAGPFVDPFSVAPVCTSKRTWTRGNNGNQQMNPGLACINCHSRDEGPRFAIAGTLYPTAHEPDLCNGFAGNGSGAQVVIIGANGQQVMLTPNAAGNFSHTGNITRPYKAKVVYMGRERAMVQAQMSGDCNGCHTQNGAMGSGTMKAPGRILLP